VAVTPVDCVTDDGALGGLGAKAWQQQQQLQQTIAGKMVFECVTDIH
jgi:hypothetical protein